MSETISMRSRTPLVALLLALSATAGWQLVVNPAHSQTPPATAAVTWPPEEPELATAAFASGCFWCTQYDFDQLPGVVSTTTGYTGGWTRRPTYYQVATGRTGHVEALRVQYDPKKISYGKLLDYYWRHVDPLDGNGQFCDRGNEYRPVIFAYSEEQAKEAEASKKALEASQRFPRPIAVTIAPAGEFWPAEPEHQNYYKTHQWRYFFFRIGCGRDARLEALWGKPAAAATN